MKIDVGKTVLVVDDEPLVRMVGAEMMADLGFEVLEAENGSDALRILESRAEIALLLTDIRMPNMDGVELAQKARLSRPGLKVIFVSGYSSLSDAAATPLLKKPYDSHSLGTLVDCVVHEGSARSD